MNRCVYAGDCPFFSGDVGYSPEMYESMREKYCFDASQDCVRLIARETLPTDCVPFDLMPTDHERFARIVHEYKAGAHAAFKTIKS